MRARRRRVLGIVVLVCLLGSLLVWSGTVSPNPGQNRYPGTEALLEHDDAYVGEQVQISGTVIGTDPVVIELTHGDATRELTVRNVDRSVSPGDKLSVFGTVQAGDAIVATAVSTRESWETQYMYLVSFIGGLWVLLRLLNGWRFEADHWTLKPRERLRVRWYGGDDA